jgi:phage I-like protein
VQNPQWTDRAKSLIASNEYRFVSPTFKYSSDTYEVSELVNIAITNSPALLGLTDLSKVALSHQVAGMMPKISNAELAHIAILTGTIATILKAAMQENEAALQANENAEIRPELADYFSRIFG